MRKPLLLAAAGCLLWLAGCAQVQEKPAVPGQPVAREDAEALAADFQSRLADKYEVVSSVVFQYNSFSISSIGLTAVDLASDRLSVAGISTVGITLFRVTAVKGEVTDSFIAPEISKYGDVAKVVIGSIHDVYFNLAPRETLVRERKDDGLHLQAPVRDGSRLEYVFSEQDRTLREKHLYRNGQRVWSIYYAEWLPDAAGHIHPRSIRLEHRQYQYHLLLNIKEVRPL